MMIRCSIGTAKVLGLKKVRVDALPTTAYLMVGERCHFNCAFCAQARESSSRAELLSLGVEHVSIALDAATSEIYDQSKDGSWAERFALLSESADLFPGHIATHLIVGLGESEEDMVRCLQTMYDKGVTVALFAFTPIKGTRMEGLKQPDMSLYRRVQVAHDLIRTGLGRVDHFQFKDGQLIDFGLDVDELQQKRGGEPFLTSGCSGCNRPYYNETPGEELYNYPKPLTVEEVENAWAHVGEVRDNRGGV